MFPETTMRRRPSSRWIWFGPSDSSTSASDASGTAPRGVSTSTSASPARVRALSASCSDTAYRRGPSITSATRSPPASIST